jgi:hypothetical protein
MSHKQEIPAERVSHRYAYGKPVKTGLAGIAPAFWQSQNRPVLGRRGT